MFFITYITFVWIWKSGQIDFKLCLLQCSFIRLTFAVPDLMTELQRDLMLYTLKFPIKQNICDVINCQKEFTLKFVEM